MKVFRDNVNNGTNYSGKTIQLKNDVTITETWTPIGTDSNNFKGTFDGGGNEITFNVTSDQTIEDVEYCGLFGYVNSATIQNLGVAGDINIDGSSLVYFGSIVGYGRYSYVKNCYNECNISIYTDNFNDVYAGGIAGIIKETGNCINYGDLIVSNGDGSGSSRSLYLGGISGDTDDKAYNCINMGDVKGCVSANTTCRLYIGGMFAVASNVYNCFNMGDVTASATLNSGGAAPSLDVTTLHLGIGGISSSGSVYNCFSIGAISYTASGVITENISANYIGNGTNTNCAYKKNSSYYTGTGATLTNQNMKTFLNALANCSVENPLQSTYFNSSYGIWHADYPWWVDSWGINRKTGTLDLLFHMSMTVVHNFNVNLSGANYIIIYLLEESSSGPKILQQFVAKNGDKINLELTAQRQVALSFNVSDFSKITYSTTIDSTLSGRKYSFIQAK